MLLLGSLDVIFFMACQLFFIYLVNLVLQKTK